MTLEQYKEQRKTLIARRFELQEMARSAKKGARQLEGSISMLNEIIAATEKEEAMPHELPVERPRPDPEPGPKPDPDETGNGVGVREDW